MPFQEAIFTRRIMPQPHSYLQERFCRGFMNLSSFFCLLPQTITISPR